MLPAIKFLFLIILSAWAFSVRAADWKILVYMQADNDLAPYAMLDLQEMTHGLIGNEGEVEKRLKIMIHLDMPGPGGIREFVIDPKKTPQANIQSGRMFPETGSSQAKRLGEFLLRAEAAIPSEKTMLVVWGHGEGWSAGLAQFGGVALDESPQSRMSVEEVRAAIALRNNLQGDTIDLLAMDACLMQTIETAYAFKDAAKFFSGSAQTQNFKGLPYHLVVDYILKDLEREAASSSSDESYYLAKKLPGLFAQEYERLGEYDSETMSAVSGKELAGVFLPAFSKAIDAVNQRLRARPFEIFSLKQHLSDMPFFLGNSRDLDALLASLEAFYSANKSRGVLKDIRESRKALGRSALSYTYGPNYFDNTYPGYYLGAFRAFGIWFPSNKTEYEARLADFEKSVLYQTHEFAAYKAFLKKLFAGGMF